MTHIQLDESIVDRTHRLIRDFYWDALTRRIDATHINEVVGDTKVGSKYDYIYVPGSDPVAVKYFQTLEQTGAARHRTPPLKVVILPAPDKITGDFVRNLDGAHGILSLKLKLDAQGAPAGGVP
jgi:alpha,alpha-trehalase